MATPTRIALFTRESTSEAARLIWAGEPVAVPTETVYGLAADATNAAAVAAIYAAKGRPSFNPLIVHVSDLAAAEGIGVFDDAARALAARYWPGPLTLVVPLRPEAGIAALVTAGLDTIALRVPAHPAMRALLAACGKPLAAPSANASNAISPTRAEHVLATLDGRIPLVIDGGPTEAGLESTIVRTGPHPAVLRLGPIPAEELGLAFAREGKVSAPGQLSSHYAPNKPLRIDATATEPDEYWIGYGAIRGDDWLGEDTVSAAARLFDALHRADASDRARIAVAPIPREGVGAAIADRLARAAHR